MFPDSKGFLSICGYVCVRLQCPTPTFTQWGPEILTVTWLVMVISRVRNCIVHDTAMQSGSFLLDSDHAPDVLFSYLVATFVPQIDELRWKMMTRSPMWTPLLDFQRARCPNAGERDAQEEQTSGVRFLRRWMPRMWFIDPLSVFRLEFLVFQVF